MIPRPDTTSCRPMVGFWQPRLSMMTRGLFSYRLPAAALILGTLTVAGTCISPTARAADVFISLEDAMSRDEQVQSGVDSLTPEQRAYLNEWLRVRFGEPHAPASVERERLGQTPTQGLAGEAAGSQIEAEIERRVAAEVAIARAEMEAQVAQAKAEIKADDQAEENLEPFEARITGDFRGWHGSTVFTLDNGQVWRQRHGSSYRHTSGDTRVKFETNWLGMWEMTVMSSGRTAVVKRLD